MNVYAISDLHLSGRPPFKNMEEFGSQYDGYMEKIEAGFKSLPSGSVVINAGDTSWAIGRDEALADFQWLDSMGVKIVHTLGNHDYYWGKKGAAFMSGWALDNGLKNTYFVDHQQLFTIGHHGLTMAAVRGSSRWVELELEPKLLPNGHRAVTEADISKRWEKALRRLEAALALRPDILVSHIPPFDIDGLSNEMTNRIVQAGVKMVIYGHRHGTPYGFYDNKFVDGVFWLNALSERCDFVPIPIGVVDEQGLAEISIVGTDCIGVIAGETYTLQKCVLVEKVPEFVNITMEIKP